MRKRATIDSTGEAVLLLQALYSVRSERMLMEHLDYNLLFRWFVGLNMGDSVCDVTVFTKIRERLLDGETRRSPRSRSHVYDVEVVGAQ